MRRLSIAFLAMTASACAAQTDAAPDRVPMAGSCRGDALAAFQGREATQSLGSEMLRASGASTLRWVPDGTMVTMMYVAGRVTVFLDASNKVRSASCS